MADDYGTCPHDVFDDERLEGAPLGVITGYVALIMLADDHGIFDANTRVLARRWGCSAPEVSALFDELRQRNLLQVYDCNDGERDRRGGLLLGFHSYLGHPERVRFASKRGESCLPFPDGGRALPRRQRGGTSAPEPEKRGTVEEVARKRRGSAVAVERHERGSAAATAPEAAVATPATQPDDVAWQARGSVVEATGQRRGNPEGSPLIRNERAPEQHSTAQHSRAERSGAPHRAPPEKPSPPGSTDARAIEAPPSAPPPALGGREAQEAPGGKPPAPVVAIPSKAEREERQRRLSAEARRLLAEKPPAFVPPTPEEIAADEARIAAEERALQEARERERCEYEPPPVTEAEPDWDLVAAQFAARAGEA